MSDKNQELINGLNEDLAAEYAAVIMYRTYASLVKGPYRQELRSFFSAEIADELIHAQLLADKVVALGGTPTVEPAPVRMALDAKQMLQNALQAEEDALVRYVKRRRQAEQLEHHALAIEIDTLLADEARHRDEMTLMLEQWD